MSLTFLIILFLLLLAANFLFRKIVKDLKIKSEKLSFFHGFLPITELIVWTIFVVWATNHLTSDSRFHLYINFLTLTLGFVLISWFFIKDYISGVQIKSRFLLSEGQIIRCAQANGRIKKMGLLLMEVVTENGSEFKIPYAQIDQKTIEINFSEKGKSGKSFEVVLAAKSNNNLTADKIKELILNSPWGDFKNPPEIKITTTKNDQVCFKISSVTIGPNGSTRLKELIKKEFGSSKKAK